jgi:NAD(P)-dependent dehydrogenase (short-subunit alcohol dehydrogenase family)
LAAANAATGMLTRALALELCERDITVNAVALGVHRPCEPNRVADVIAYLLSDHGHHLTGQVLRVGDPGSRP